MVDPSVFIVTLILGILLGGLSEHVRARLSWLAWRARRDAAQGKGTSWQRPALKVAAPSEVQRPASGPRDPADQLRIVMGADFSIQPLLNRSEARVFRELDRLVIAHNPEWQVMAQVSLGEILRCKDSSAYSCINSKRVDLLLVDKDCRPRHVVEYQGTGHHQSDAAARDAVKKEALRRAGIGYHEVIAGQTTPADLRRLVGRLVDAPGHSVSPKAAPAMEPLPMAASEPPPRTEFGLRPQAPRPAADEEAVGVGSAADNAPAPAANAAPGPWERTAARNRG